MSDRSSPDGREGYGACDDEAPGTCCPRSVTSESTQSPRPCAAGFFMGLGLVSGRTRGPLYLLPPLPQKSQIDTTPAAFVPRALCCI